MLFSSVVSWIHGFIASWRKYWEDLSGIEPFDYQISVNQKAITVSRPDSEESLNWTEVIRFSESPRFFSFWGVDGDSTVTVTFRKEILTPQQMAQIRDVVERSAKLTN